MRPVPKNALPDWFKRKCYQREEWSVVLRRDPCVYCGERGGTVEHVNPRGPRSPVSNGVGACEKCNGERGSVPLIYYLIWRSTDRTESFNRWNFRCNAERIQIAQTNSKEWRKAQKNPPPEKRASTLRVQISEILRAASIRS